MIVLAVIALLLATFPLLLFVRNVRLFLRPCLLPSPAWGGGLGVKGNVGLSTPHPPEPAVRATSPTRGEVGGAGIPLPATPPHSHPTPTSPLVGEVAGVSEANPAGGGYQVSVLIPARNEELGIAACVRSILASTNVTVEVIVLDDSSTDRTAEIVKQLATADPRVRLETAPLLPPGWCGKQHACYTLSKLAKHEVITFLDADVSLEPQAMAKMVGFLHSSGAALVSGFPRQITVGLLEQLVIPLIHWLLVCYLPFDRMRKDLQPGLGAGCGQWFMTTKLAYEKVGGHGHPLVKGSLHDGIKLPRAYRTCGLMTDTCDATADASCRMYRSAGAVWNGFAKNAREGLGGPVTIWIWTVLLAGGHLLSWVMAVVCVPLAFEEAVRERFFYHPISDMHLPQPGTEPPGFAARTALGLSVLACVVSLAPRLACAWLYRQSWLGAIFHPVGVLLMLAIQWYATVRAWVGRPVGWKGRGHPSLPSGHG